MSYQAIICRITVRPHPKADRLQLGSVAGHQIVTGLDTQNSTVGSLNGKEVCRKYVSPATKAAIARAAKQGKRRKADPIMFKQHYDTGKLRYGINNIPDAASLIITEKLHGTSGRTGHVLVEKDLPKWKQWRVWNLLGVDWKPKEEWQHVTGTRRVVLQNAEEGENGYYAGMQFRKRIHDSLSLRKGETVYYEIVGYDDNGNPLFSHPVAGDKKDETRKHLEKQYGSRMVYSYGQEDGLCSMFVYRITLANVDGDVVELSWNQLVARCAELGLKHVPVLAVGTTANTSLGEPEMWFETSMGANTDYEMPLLALCSQLSHGASSLDHRHISEGVCVRVEHPEMTSVFKYKSFAFCHLENIKKNNDAYIDLEEAS